MVELKPLDLAMQPNKWLNEDRRKRRVGLLARR